MIQEQSWCKVADNTGAKLVECIKVYGGTRRRYATLGDVVLISIKEAIPHSKVKKGEIYKAVVVRVSAPVKRIDGTVIKFDSNAVVLLNKQGETVGTAVSGPVARELRDKKFMRIVSLAEEVL